MRPLIDEESPLRPDAGGRLFDRIAGAGVFAAALALRLAYLSKLARTPLYSQLVLDPLYYHDWAVKIAGGDWLSGRQVFEQSPLYAYILAVTYRIAGDGLLAPRLVQAVVGSFTSLLVFLIARRLFGRPAALAAGLFMAAYGPALFYDGMIMKTTWAVFLTTAMTAALVFSEGSRRGMLFSAGALLGAAALVRDNLILLAPMLAAWLAVDLLARRALDSGKLKEAVVRVALFAAGTTLAVLPVTIRNRAVSGEWVLLTAGGGEVFYIGNNPEADGKYSPPEFVRATSVVEHEDFRHEAARRLGHAVTRREASQYWLNEGVRWIRSNPFDYMMLLKRKLLVFFNTYELPDNQNFYHHRFFVPLLSILPTWAVLLPLASAGFVLSIRAWRGLLPLYVIGGGYIATVMLFFNFARFRMPIVPILVLFAGEGIVEILSMASGAVPWRRTVAAAAAGGVAAVVALLPPGNDALHRGQASAQLSELMREAGRTEEAAVESDRGIALLESIYLEAGGRPGADGHGVALAADRSRPDLGASYYGVLMDAYHSRGRIEAGRSRPAEALRWLERAAAAAPDPDVGFDALLAYGEALIAAGRYADALIPLGRARRAWPAEPRLALLYGRALHGLGRLEEAVRAIESGLGTPAPIDDVLLGDINYELALVEKDLGDLPRMRYHLRETLKKNPHHPQAASIQRMLAD